MTVPPRPSTRAWNPKQDAKSGSSNAEVGRDERQVDEASNRGDIIEHAVLACAPHEIASTQVEREEVGVEDRHAVDLVGMESHASRKTGVLVRAGRVVILPRLQEGDRTPPRSEASRDAL